jgi:hypothetical protein
MNAKSRKAFMQTSNSFESIFFEDWQIWKPKKLALLFFRYLV